MNTGSGGRTRRNAAIATAILLAACAGQREAKQEQDAAADKVAGTEQRADARHQSSEPLVAPPPASADATAEQVVLEAEASRTRMAGNQSAAANPYQTVVSGSLRKSSNKSFRRRKWLTSRSRT